MPYDIAKHIIGDASKLSLPMYYDLIVAQSRTESRYNIGITEMHQILEHGITLGGLKG